MLSAWKQQLHNTPEIMKQNTINVFCRTIILIAVIYISGCAENIRDESADNIVGRVEHRLMPDEGLTWFAPELFISHYRTLFYGYNTIEYRLAASEHPESKINDSFQILINVNYGGKVRHYDFARFTDLSTRPIKQHNHAVVRCEIFNYMTSSCLYSGKFSINLSRSDLEKAHLSGLQLLLASTVQQYELIDLPANYIQGFLKALESQEHSYIYD